MILMKTQMGSAKKLWEELNSDKVDAYQAAYRERHGDAIRARSRKRAQRPDVKLYDQQRGKARRDKHRGVLQERLGGCCVNCGATDHLEFNHRYPGDKEYSVTLRLNCNLESLYNETDKCELLCKPCHKQLTSRQKELAWQLLCQLSNEEYDRLINTD
jgi:5-methylcytosine-specific restriction endonuclease McrA